MGLVLACVARIMHGDWSIRLGENRPDRAIKHLAAMLMNTQYTYNASSNDGVHEVESGFICITGTLEFINSMVLKQIKKIK